MSKRKQRPRGGAAPGGEDRPAPRWTTVALAALVVVLPFVVLYWTVPFVGTTSIGMDYVIFPTAHQQELIHSVAHGTWPLYVPGFAGGRPAAALTLGQLYHPIAHLASRLPGYWSGHAIEANTLLRLLSLGCTQLVLLFLLRRWGLRLEIAFLLSFVTVYNMRMLDMFRFGAALENYTGHLLLCGAIGMSYLRPSRWALPAAIAGSTYLLVVGGHPQMFYLALLGSALFTLLVPFVTAAVRDEPRPPWTKVVRFYAATALWTVAGLMLASVYTVPLYYDFVVETPGRAAMGYEWSLHNTDSWGGELNNFFSPLEVGVPGAFGGSSIVLLALLAPLALVPRRRARGPMIAAWLSMLLVIAVALGGATPVHYLFWKYFPLASAFRVPGRVVIVVPALLLLLLAWVFAGGSRRLALRRVAPAAVGLFLLHRLWFSEYLPAPSYPVPVQFRELGQGVLASVAWLGLVVLVLAALYGLLPKARTAVGILLALLAVAQTGQVLRHGTWVSPNIATPTAAAMDAAKTESLLFRGNPGNRTQSALVDRILSDSFIDGPLAKFYRDYEIVENQQEAFAALASTRSPHEIVVESFEPREADRMTKRDRDRADRVVLEQASVNRLSFSVENHAPGFLNLTLLDRYRWKAFIDGEEVPSYRADGGERAVYLPAGSHDVEFRYWSPAAFAGVVVSLLTLGAFGVFLAFRLPRSRGAVRIVVLVVALAAPTALFAWWKHGLYHGDNLGTRYAWDSSQLPDARNLAYGRKTQMSGLRNPFLPYDCYGGRGVDGDREGTGFSTDPGRSPWWQVDLGSRHPIHEIAVFPGDRTRRRAGLALRVLVSDDGGRYEEVGWIIGNPKRLPWTLVIEERRARFVRIQQPGTGVLSLYEIEVYGPRR